MGALTFGLGYDRKGTFAVLGRGHLRVLGGGARSLSCSSHVRGGDVAVVDKDDRLWYSGLNSHFTLHTKCLENAPTRAGGENNRDAPKSLSHTVSALAFFRFWRYSCAMRRDECYPGSGERMMARPSGQGMRRARQQQQQQQQHDDVPSARQRQRKVRGKTLRSDVSILGSTASEDAIV